MEHPLSDKVVAPSTISSSAARVKGAREDSPKKSDHRLALEGFTVSDLWYYKKYNQERTSSIEVQCNEDSYRCDAYPPSSHDIYWRGHESSAFDDLNGIGIWADEPHPVTEDVDLKGSYLLSSGEVRKDTPPFGYMHEVRRGLDHVEMWAWARNEGLLKSKHLNTSDATSEYVPSLTTDLNTLETVSAGEDDTHRENVAQLDRIVNCLSLVSVTRQTQHVGSWFATRQLACSENIEEPAIAPGIEADMGTVSPTDVNDDDWEDNPSDSPEELWISDYSEEGCIIEVDHPMWREHGSSILNALLTAFQKHPESCYQETGGEGSEYSSNKSKGKEQASNPNSRAKGGASQTKRSYTEFSTEGGNGSPAFLQTCSKKILRSNQKKLLFACPFCKNSPLRYRKCYSIKITQISYVKQHLSRVHYYPIYCSICMECFNSEDSRDIHTRAGTCQRQPLVDWGGVTQAQKQKLREKPPKNTSKEDQWFTIFKILFPGHPLPASPYIDSDLSEQLYKFQDFAASRGAAIAIDVLRPTTMPESILAPFLERVMLEGIPAIVQQFMESRQSPGSGTSLASIADTTSRLDPLGDSNVVSLDNYIVLRGSATADGGSTTTLQDDNTVGNPIVNDPWGALQMENSEMQSDFGGVGDAHVSDSRHQTNIGDQIGGNQGDFGDGLQSSQTENWLDDSWLDDNY